MTTLAQPRVATRQRADAVPVSRRKVPVKWIIATILIVIYALGPILWILSLSFKSSASISDGKLIPTHPTWDNYRTIFNTGVFVRPLINSMGIAIISTVIAVTLAMLAAYAIARLNFPGKALVLSAALAIA